jgi:putative ABC transport system permease protein
MNSRFWRRNQQRRQQLEQEIEAHLEMAKRDRLDHGASPHDAASAARREFGNLDLVQRVTREQWGWLWLEEFLQDLRYGVRLVRRNPGFTLVAVLTLMLGIGANTAIFSLVNGVLLQPLPLPHSDRLVGLTQYYPKHPFVLMRDQSRTMDVIANTDNTDLNLTGGYLPERLTGTSVSANWFSVLGAEPTMGRTFQTGEDQPGKDHLVIISHSLWERRFGRDPNMIGRSLTLSGIDRQVIGVMPADFRYPNPKTELWIPLDLDQRDQGEYFYSSYMPLAGRLRSGATLEQARAEIKHLRASILATYPRRMPDDVWADGSIEPLQEVMVGNVRTRLLVLLAAVGLLLLIACANVANLLLARATSRQREIAVRSALGAGRWRITRQLLTESVFISLMGGALGLGAARYALTILKATLPADMPRLVEVGIDSRVLFFTAAVSIVTGLLFGLMPAASGSKSDLTKSLKSGGERGGSAGHQRLSSALVIGEVGISVILVIAAGLLIKSLWNLANANPGFRSDQLVTARVSPNQSFCEAPGRCQAFYGDLLERVRALPGVKDAGAVNGLPLTETWEDISSDIEAHPVLPGAHVTMLMERICTPNYFKIMDIPLLQGRPFTSADAAPSAQRVVLISKKTAERFWRGKSPIGEHLKPRWLKEWWTVVGVVGDVREYSLSQDFAQWVDGEIYTPYGAHSIRDSGPEAPPVEMTLVIRTPEAQTPLGSQLQSMATQLNGDVPVTQVQTMSGWLWDAAAGTRSTTSLFSLFAALAVVLGAVGIYGVISYSVAQRTREIGIRVAMGAPRKEILYLIVGQGAVLACAGVALGLLGALLLTRLMSSLLFGVGALDATTYASVALLMVVVAVASSYIPARRAMRVDPVVALRYE